MSECLEMEEVVAEQWLAHDKMRIRCIDADDKDKKAKKIKQDFRDKQGNEKTWRVKE